MALRRKAKYALLLSAAVLCVGAYAARHTRLRLSAESLVCVRGEAPSDAILIDNVEYSYLLFEHAQELKSQGLASTVLVPILGEDSEAGPTEVSLGFVDVMCRAAHISECITFSVPAVEPFSLNLARSTAQELQTRGIRSVLLVTDGFRSRRDFDLYAAVLRPLNITVHCQPVFGTRTPLNWSDSTHGVQEVGLQLMKLWYYRITVMPRLG